MSHQAETQSQAQGSGLSPLPTWTLPWRRLPLDAHTENPCSSQEPRRHPGCPKWRAVSAGALLPWGPQREWVPCAYLVEGRHGSGAHHQGYADDGVAVEAVRVGHHDDARDGEDGRHDLQGGREGDSVSLQMELQVP